ncbi:MAG: nitrogenase iron-molybdenum cofactor biosynthesis protein NifN [Polyangiales bacterium]
MATIVKKTRTCSINPLKSSTPLGAALAYLGMEGAVPLFHGAQGCTAFALVLAVRHFKEAIPLQTTAMDEVTTILGGMENLESALCTLKTRMKPKFIGIASTSLVETSGEDFVGELRVIKQRKADVLDGTAIVFASTPDFNGALEEGWSAAVKATIETLVEGPLPQVANRVNLLPGVHQTAAEIDELRNYCEMFGLSVRVVPDISTTLDGHVPEEYVGTTYGGTRVADVARLGEAAHTIAIGEHMRAPAEALHALADVPFSVLPTLTGLEASDNLVRLLTEISGVAAPHAIRRQRSQLLDAMLDGHFWFSGKRIAIGSDPDLLYTLSTLFTSLGAQIVSAVASTGSSPILAQVPCENVVVSDLVELEEAAAAGGAELLVTHSHGRMASERLGIPLLRVGFPIFDRLGVQDRSWVGYRGTRALIYEVANVFQSALHAHKPEDFAHVGEGGHAHDHA